MESPTPTQFFDTQSRPGRDGSFAEGDRDFSQSPLKPAPLRLTRKSQSSTDQIFQDAHETSLPRTTTATPPAAHPMDSFRGDQGLAFLELSPPLKLPLPSPSKALAPGQAGLAALVSKFETLEAASSPPPIARRKSGASSVVKAELFSYEPKPTFPAHTPYPDRTKLAARRSDTGSASTMASSQISPTQRLSPLAHKHKHPSGKDKTGSPATSKWENGSCGSDGFPSPSKNPSVEDQTVFVQSPRGVSDRQHADDVAVVSWKKTSGVKEEEMKGWDSKIVAERRKVFEKCHCRSIHALPSLPGNGILFVECRFGC
jgi:hypothetical protein